MFTGIIEEVGTIARAEPAAGGRAFFIRATTVLEGLRLGDSISVDGACHTVTEIQSEGFAFHSVATTLKRTSLGAYHQGRRVNLERALALGDRLGGHLVQGHVDAVGSVRAIERHGDHVLIDFSLPEIVAQVSILHGSIALNGVSLTINALPEVGVAQVSIIPHTWEVTALADLTPGDPVNLEGDMIGKYVRHLLDRADSAAPPGSVHLPRNSGY
jgi:riboflavin synthase